MQGLVVLVTEKMFVGVGEFSLCVCELLTESCVGDGGSWG